MIALAETFGRDKTGAECSGHYLIVQEERLDPARMAVAFNARYRIVRAPVRDKTAAAYSAPTFVRIDRTIAPIGRT
jgi:hypothetical protein